MQWLLSSWKEWETGRQRWEGDFYHLIAKLRIPVLRFRSFNLVMTVIVVVVVGEMRWGSHQNLSSPCNDSVLDGLSKSYLGRYFCLSVCLPACLMIEMEGRSSRRRPLNSLSLSLRLWKTYQLYIVPMVRIAVKTLLTPRSYRHFFIW